MLTSDHTSARTPQHSTVPPQVLADRLDLAVLVHSSNDGEDATLLAKRVDEHLAGSGLSWQLVFIDDSDDDTPYQLADLGTVGVPVRVLHRRDGERVGGMSGALVEGFAAVEASVIAVLDPGLRHSPEQLLQIIEPLHAGEADVTIGSRFLHSSSITSSDGRIRQSLVQLSTRLNKVLFPVLRNVSDTTSGYFAFRAEVLDGVVLRPEVFRVLVEVLIRGRWKTVTEVGIDFSGHVYEPAQIELRDGAHFLRHTARRWLEMHLDTRGDHHGRTDRTFEEAAKPLSTEPVDPMKVLVVASELPPVKSGISTTAGRVAVDLAERGHHMTLHSNAQSWTRHIGEFRFVGAGLQLARTGFPASRFDVVHVHGPVPMVTELALLRHGLSRRSRRAPLIYTHHFDIELQGLEIPSLIYNALHRGLARLADGVVVSSPSYERIVGGSPSVVPWAIDAALNTEDRCDYTGDEPLRILLLGQQRPYKGVDKLIQAAAGQPELHLTVAGSGPLEDRHQSLAELLQADNITFLGRVPDDDLDELYRSHDVIALPSINRMEAFGMVLLEGMRAGCVPVASDLPGVRDVLGDVGCLVPPRRVLSLRQALLGLAHNPDFVRLQSLRSQHRAASFDWPSTTDAYEQILHDAMSTNRSHP